MRYCALMGDIEWYEDGLVESLEKAMTDIADKYGSVTFIAAPMCVYNGRVSGAIARVKKHCADVHFVLCTHQYNNDYVAPGEPFETIIIPADINKVEDFYPYMCNWIIEKCETALIYIDRKTLFGENLLSINAAKLAEYAKKTEKEVIEIKIEPSDINKDEEKNTVNIFHGIPDDFFYKFEGKEKTSVVEEEKKMQVYPDFDYEE